jgi:hypothetical protein
MLLEKRKVRIRLLEDMLGTVPANKAVYSEYIESKKPVEMQEEREADTIMEKLEEKGYTIFHSDEEGIFLYNYMVKGFLKHAGNVMKGDDNLGVKALKSKLSDFLFVFPRRIHVGKAEADGIFERPLRADTPKGPRTSLSRSDKLNAGTEIEFEIHWLPHPEIKEELIRELLEYGQLQGLGQFRNGSFGSFEVVAFEPIGGVVKKGKAKA